MDRIEMALSIFIYSIITLTVLGWVDTLWIFGVEDSQQYTWWALMNWIGG